MRTLSITLASFAAGLAIAALWVTGGTGLAGGGSPQAAANGDVNGDGDLDVSDAIYLLTHLFRGGSAPVACADSPELVARVDALEDTASALSAAVSSSRSLCREASDRFADNGDGTLADRCSGLMWQKRTADASGDGVIDFSDLVSRSQAQQYVANLDLGGHADWRLPTLPELRALVDEERVGPAADPGFADLVVLQPPPGGTNVYRSTSHPSCCDDSDFGVVFDVGTVAVIGADDAAFVLAVRG